MYQHVSAVAADVQTSLKCSAPEELASFQEPLSSVLRSQTFSLV